MYHFPDVVRTERTGHVLSGRSPAMQDVDHSVRVMDDQSRDPIPTTTAVPMTTAQPPQVLYVERIMTHVPRDLVGQEAKYNLTEAEIKVGVLE